MNLPVTQAGVARVADVLAQAPPGAETWLSASEYARLQRLRVSARRDHYLAGHWLLRQLLATHCGGAPEAWSLRERDGLPPQIDGSALNASLSHSGDWIAAALSPSAIGIDLEQRGPRPALERFPELLLADDDVPGTLDNDALLQRWVVKEALIKRDHGNALPEQLAALRIRRSAGAADVELLSSADFHLGVAAMSPRTLTLPVPVIARQHWKLSPNIT